MVKKKFCSECGREIKTEFRTTYEILDNIKHLLKIDIRGISRKEDLLNLEEAIKNLKGSQ